MSINWDSEYEVRKKDFNATLGPGESVTSIKEFFANLPDEIPQDSWVDLVISLTFRKKI